jgi:hypothetical protein
MTDEGVIFTAAIFYVLIMSTLMYLLGYCVGRKIEKENKANKNDEEN